jgi:hypothetical protein
MLAWKHHNLDKLVPAECSNMKAKRLDSPAQLILLGILTDVRLYQDTRWAGFERNGAGVLRLLKHRAAVAGYCRYRPADWVCGSLDSAARKNLSTALRHLENDGLVIVERDGRERVTWVSLTAKGSETANQLAESRSVVKPQ